MAKEFLSPSEVEKLKSKRTIVDNNVDFEQGETLEESFIEKPKSLIKKQEPLNIKNNAGKVKIDYESMGRFNIPATMYFSGYTVDHIDNFALVTEENIFETLVTIIEDLKQDDIEAKVEDMLIEEFFETLIGIKMQFDTIAHVHRWICDCQQNASESEKIINETIVNLKELNYISIEQADEKYKEMCREAFKDDKVFDNFIKMKYGENCEAKEYDKETEIKQLRVVEPYTVASNTDIFKFRFLRVKDLIIANRYITKKYAGKIKAIKNKQMHNVKAQDLKLMKEEELEVLNQQKGKEFLRALKASTLVEYNGKFLDSLEDKMDVYRIIPMNVALNSTTFLDTIKFGVDHEQDFECPICGFSERRSLRFEFNFIEFIPVKPNSSDALGNITRGNIFMGI